MMRRLAALLACVTASLSAAGTAQAQGALSVLGLGYPVGGLSSRTLSSGASLAGLDPHSPVNPAAIVLNARSQAYVQLEPEFRTVTVGGQSVKTTSSRFPLFMATGRQGRATFALSFSSFIDRTWANSYADTQLVGTQRIGSTVLAQSTGGIADARVAMAWTLSERLHVGAAAHVYPGQNRVVNGRQFADSLKTGSFQLMNTFGFSGSALSLGAVYLSANHVQLSGDLRLGGTLSMRQGDSTLVGRGKVPLRAGLGLSYDGLAGTVLSARVSSERWSDLQGLGESSLVIKDALDVGVGAEVAGPRMSGAPALLRVGYRSRGLPATYSGSAVHETSLAGGMGVPIASGRAMIDLGLVRATRSAPGVKERAWVVSLGVGIRP